MARPQSRWIGLGRIERIGAPALVATISPEVGIPDVGSPDDDSPEGESPDVSRSVIATF